MPRTGLPEDRGYEHDRPDRSSWYAEGIRRAAQDGRIHYRLGNGSGEPPIADDYSHIRDDAGAPLLLKYTNTRPLSLIARWILDLYRESADVRVLELGPGAGIACAAVSRLLPLATIDIVSLTPLNPYLRFRWDDVYGHITAPMADDQCLSRLYSECCPPFVRNQYIGRFPREISLCGETYHFIYENHGAIFHNLLSSEHRDPTEIARASICSALSLLRCDGTMVIMASDGALRIEDALESASAGADIIVTCRRTTAYHSFPCILAREGSPLWARFRVDEHGLLSTSQRILRLDAHVLEDVISRICRLLP
ncbi:hypothetical protein JQ633_26575 [Bradyrhizobium tropiciagri]|uniref:hypothetical protein n=1 Tax=Bradyrhizobium tropiciagri TaxID=312253 RepID=UPI001BA68D32|nr:hypothetical protein [Bradyrhizobium tropiciagri]MBR0873952.1 hypothetical protein [Bradyrhizobium tropiciagri]